MYLVFGQDILHKSMRIISSTARWIRKCTPDRLFQLHKFRISSVFEITL